VLQQFSVGDFRFRSEYWVRTDKSGLALSYRQKLHGSLRRFFGDMCAHYDVVGPRPSIIG